VTDAGEMTQLVNGLCEEAGAKTFSGTRGSRAIDESIGTHNGPAAAERCFTEDVISAGRREIDIGHRERPAILVRDPIVLAALDERVHDGVGGEPVAGCHLPFISHRQNDGRDVLEAEATLELPGEPGKQIPGLERAQDGELETKGDQS
jgi:hypothetical protein